MEIEEAQEALAYLLGRGIAAEKALQTFIGNPQPNVSMHELMRTNLLMREKQLASDLATAGLPPELLPVAHAGYSAQRGAVVRGLQGNKYFPPGWRER